MKPNEINIEIAKILGRETYANHNWEGHDDNRYFVCTRCGETIGWGNYKKGTSPKHEPCVGNSERNFYGDLNACAQMEEELGPEREVYVETLFGIVPEETAELDDNESLWLMLHASAPERCEAFLRMKGKWND